MFVANHELEYTTGDMKNASGSPPPQHLNPCSWLDTHGKKSIPEG
jgi:hypothetical protein